MFLLPHRRDEAGDAAKFQPVRDGVVMMQYVAGGTVPVPIDPISRSERPRFDVNNAEHHVQQHHELAHSNGTVTDGTVTAQRRHSNSTATVTAHTAHTVSVCAGEPG